VLAEVSAKSGSNVDELFVRVPEESVKRLKTHTRATAACHKCVNLVADSKDKKKVGCTG
jgi:hypothetical protein